MKKQFQLLIILLFSSILANSQTCFENLSDISGMDHSSSLNEIDAASCAIRNLIPSNLQSSFKVYDAAFYIHTGSFSGFGYPEAFEKTKLDVNTPYYVLVAAQNEPDKGLYTKFWVDVKLPDITGNGCITNLNDEASAFLEFIIEEKFNSLNRSPHSYPQALIAGLTALENYISTAISCCNDGGNVEQCLQCSNPDNIAAKLLADGFVQEKIQNIGDYVGSTSFPAEITDYANLLFTVNDQTAVDIPSSYMLHIPIYQSKGMSVKIYITKDENVCSPIWQTIKNEVSNGSTDVIFWHHIHKGRSGLGDEKLFSRVYLKGEGSNLRERGKGIGARGPDPVTAIIGALGSAFSDYMIQGISIYYLDDSVKKGEWGKAFDKINYGSVAWSGFTGLFVVSGKAATLAVAVGAATSEVTYNSFAVTGYTMEQAGLDFARVFISDIIGNAVGGAIGSKLKNANLSWFSADALDKISETLIKQNDNVTKRLYIKFAWKLEVENLTSHSARGIDFENKLFKWLFSGQGFTQTVLNFKGIDFHRVSDNLGLSLKTTLQTSKSGLQNLIEKNVADLRQMKIDKKILFNGKEYKIAKTKLLILVPEENVNSVNILIQQLKSQLDPTNLIESFEVKSFENILGI